MDEVQYCIILNQGLDAGLKHYVWVSKEKIERVFDSYGFDNYGEVHVDLSIIAGNKKGEVLAKACFNNRRIGSLEIKASSKEEANKCAKGLGLGIPFDN